MTLVKINAAEYGLEESKAKEIAQMFKPMLDRMEALEVQFNEVMGRDIEPETIQMARDLRLAYVKVRTGTAEIHKKAKAHTLQVGRFIDGWKNTQLLASQGNEEKLREIEDHFVNIEKARIAKLQEERSIELQKYTEYVPADVGAMDEEVWKNYLSGVKLNYDARVEAERKAEKERIAKEKAEAEERERIRVENEKLKKEAEAREKAEKARIKKEEAEQKAREEREAEERAKHEAALKKEREAKAKAEAELKAKHEAEQKAREEEEARIQKELAKGDAAKVRDLVADLTILKTKYTFKSKKNKKVYSDVAILIDKVINHINQ
jgi:hypothetical protein